jgi:LAS superfamily LD-carboxypeptidase LdcB
MTAMQKLYCGLMFFLLFLLTGCKEKQSYTYYLQHPLVLKQAVSDCQSSNAKTKEQEEQCDIVMSAANKILELINEQQSHPEEFGQRILDEQRQHAKLKEQAVKAKAVLASLKQKPASSVELRAAQDDLYKARKACYEQAQQIKILLAVLGLSSPE